MVKAVDGDPDDLAARCPQDGSEVVRESSLACAVGPVDSNPNAGTALGERNAPRHQLQNGFPWHDVILAEVS